MAREPEHLTQDEATRLWARAVQLQADDAREADARAAGEAAGQLDVGSRGTPGGYALTHVRTAAIEAGIGADFFDTALADLRAEQAFPYRAHGPGLRWARLLLGHPEDAVTVRRVIEASTGDVLAALEAVLPASPYGLTLRDQAGDPATGGILVFDIMGASFTGQGGGGFAAEASWADFRQVIVSVREPGTEPPSVELTIRAPVAWAFSVNAGFSGLFTVLGGGLGLGLGSAGGAGVAALAALLGLTGGAVGVLAALVVTGGAVGGGLAGSRLYRVLYRHALGKGRTALEGLAAAVSAQAQGGWGIRPTLDSSVSTDPLPGRHPEAG
jgi:hypothetical protein